MIRSGNHKEPVLSGQHNRQGAKGRYSRQGTARMYSGQEATVTYNGVETTETYSGHEKAMILRAADEIVNYGSLWDLNKILRGVTSRRFKHANSQECPAFGYFSGRSMFFVHRKLHGILKSGCLSCIGFTWFGKVCFTPKGWELERQALCREMSGWRKQEAGNKVISFAYAKRWYFLNDEIARHIESEQSFSVHT